MNGRDDRDPMLPPEEDNELVVDGPLSFPVDRRGFLKAGAAGLLVLVAVDRAAALQETARLPRGRQGYPTDFNAYLLVKPDGRVDLPRREDGDGAGLDARLAQILADELNVAMDSVDMVMGDTDRCPWDMGTFGSLSIRQFGPVLRQAAAEARTVLLQLASERLQVPVGRLTVADGVVSVSGDRSKKVTYAQLTEGKRIERHIEGKPPLEPVENYTVVGQSIPRPDGDGQGDGEGEVRGRHRAPRRRPPRADPAAARARSRAEERGHVGGGEAAGREGRAGRRHDRGAARAPRRGRRGARPREGGVGAARPAGGRHGPSSTTW